MRIDLARRVNGITIAIVIAALALGAAGADAATTCRGKQWLGVWAASPSDVLGPAFVDQTLRLVVNPTYRGGRARVRLSNRFGSSPVTFGAVTLARRLLGADVVVDFHAALRDPATPDGLRPEFDSGDHLHPSPAGYQAMADAVDPTLLADPPCR